MRTRRIEIKYMRPFSAVQDIIAVGRFLKSGTGASDFSEISSDCA